MSATWKPGDRVRLTAEMGGYRSGTVGTIKRVHHEHVVAVARVRASAPSGRHRSAGRDDVPAVEVGQRMGGQGAARLEEAKSARTNPSSPAVS
jgi:hypothetical protein